MSAERRSFIQTVTGLVESPQVGPTLMHEHIFVDVRAPFFRQPTPSAVGHVDLSFLGCSSTTSSVTERGRPQSAETEEFTLENSFWIEYNHSSFKPNLILESMSDAVTEMKEYLNIGGSAIVELTTCGIRPRPTLLRELAQRVPGLHIVLGTGYYVNATHPEHLCTTSTEDIAAQMIRHILVGFPLDDDAVETIPSAIDESLSTTFQTRVKAGIIGELGCSYPLHADEQRVLEAAAIAQRATGTSISVHPGRDERSPFEIERVLRAAGAEMSRVIIGHLDRTLLHHPDLLIELARTGVVMEFDLFGMECSKYHFNEQVDMPSDAQRIDTIRSLVQAGYAAQIVISHDIYSKHRLRAYGGHSYDHILRNIVPRMLLRGISKDDVRLILCTTPNRLLTIQPVSQPTSSDQL